MKTHGLKDDKQNITRESMSINFLPKTKCFVPHKRIKGSDCLCYEFMMRVMKGKITNISF